MLKIPKNDSRYHWTQHAIRKMIFYGLSPDRVKRVIRNPKRVEDGVALNTIAVMTPVGTDKKPSEIWVMYQIMKHKTYNMKHKDSSFMFHASRKVIISAWRYPGVSPSGKQIPIPKDILEELKKEGYRL